MDIPTNRRFLCIHGHFYQPPRENPWTGVVEAQASARPFHDWNERVHAECYAPNGASRLLDGRGRIRGLHNNYRHMSFNFGPTLLGWMERHDPATLERILEADRDSRADQDGHGNAIAQVYNHTILPLGTDRDRRTQIGWGICDFQRRFGRDPEGMWLAETAINMPTVVALIEAGIRFTILSPTQADRVRLLDSDRWTDVSSSTIDPTRPYRVYPLGPRGEPLAAGWLDVFFYDGPVSSAIGFEHLLRDARRFADRLSSCWKKVATQPQLVSVATDGESYGHHEPFADMALAYLFETVCPERGWVPCNFGRFLAMHPPLEEVRLKNAYGEGTAWSCSHGTGRWIRDCGCNTGAPTSWNQAWRGPLREAMETLRDAAETAWDTLSPTLLTDPATTRSVLPSLPPPGQERLAWIRTRITSETEPWRALALLELVRMGQYVLTSCAWFFNDVTGLEPVQNMRYASRGCRLLQLLGRKSPEDALRGILERALSNTNVRTGRHAWDLWVHSSHDPDAAVAAQAVWEHLLAPERRGFSDRNWSAVVRPGPRGPTHAFGEVDLEDHDLLRTHIFRWGVALRPDDRDEVRVLRGPLPTDTSTWADASLERLQEILDEHFATSAFAATSLPWDRRLDLARRVEGRAFEELRPRLEDLAVAARVTADRLRELDVPPASFLRLADQVLLEATLRNLLGSSLGRQRPEALADVARQVEEARKLGVQELLELPSVFLQAALEDELADLADPAIRPSALHLERVCALLDIAETVRVPVRRSVLEDKMDRILTARFGSQGEMDSSACSILLDVAERLNFDVDSQRAACDPPSPPADTL